MSKIILMIFISVFMLGCQANNTAEEVDDLSDSNSSINVADDINDSVYSDTNITDLYKDYFDNNASTPPPIPQFEN